MPDHKIIWRYSTCFEKHHTQHPLFIQNTLIIQKINYIMSRYIPLTNHILDNTVVEIKISLKIFDYIINQHVIHFI